LEDLKTFFSYTKTFFAYAFSGSYIAMDIESLQSQLLFVGAIILLILQIRLHVLKIKNEKKGKK
jgi:hypothetical protein